MEKNIETKSTKKELKKNIAIIFSLTVGSILIAVFYFLGNRQLDILTLFIFLPSGIMFSYKPVWKTINENKFALVLAFISLFVELACLIGSVIPIIVN